MPPDRARVWALAFSARLSASSTSRMRGLVRWTPVVPELDSQRLAHREEGIEVHLLRDEAHVVARPERVLVQVHPEEAHRPAGLLHQPDRPRR